MQWACGCFPAADVLNCTRLRPGTSLHRICFQYLGRLKTQQEKRELSMESLEHQLIRVELEQRQQEGCDTADIRSRIEAVLEDGAEDSVFRTLYDELVALDPVKDFPYSEPSLLDDIRALRPEGPRRLSLTLGEEALSERIHGAWLGRAVGCSLGKPVEGWPKHRIDNYLGSVEALPLTNYIPYREGTISPGLKTSTRDNIEFMARDDDMDFPILGLLALEQKGATFSPRHMADVWLSYMPFHLLYTAENVAYRNLVNRRWPPESATWRNPFREWIGAQIRADIFGYVTPGWPEKGAELAFRDASISHVKNGIYGEMFVAAMLSAAFVTADIDQIIEIGLSEIPTQCRLAEAIRDTLAWCNKSDDWEAVWSRIDDKYGHYHGVHTINNAAFVTMGLKFGADDYEQGIVVTVRSGSDTDCTGATVGSILGAKFGASALPTKWTDVLSDRLMSSVRDNNDNRISALAERTLQVAIKMLNVPDVVEEETVTEPFPQGMSEGLPGIWNFQLGFGRHELRVRPDLTGEIEMIEFNEVKKISDVKIDGNRVCFSFGVDKGGYEVDIAFDGTIDGDRLIGQCSSGGFEFSATGKRTSG